MSYASPVVPEAKPMHPPTAPLSVERVGVALALVLATACAGGGPTRSGHDGPSSEPWAKGRIAFSQLAQDTSSDTLYVLDLAANRSSTLSDSRHFYSDFSWNGGDIVFSDFVLAMQSYQLYAINPNGGTSRQIFPSPGNHMMAPGISRQGRVAYYLKSLSPFFFGTAIDGMPAFVGGSEQSHPTWSPDGHELVVSDGAALSMYDASVWPPVFKATVIKRNTDEWLYDPVYSPDGSQIAFARDYSPVGAAGTQTIWIVSVDGTGSHQVTSGPRDNSPVWSPDGSKLAFTRSETYYAVYVVNPDGSGIEKLLDGPVNGFIAWVP